MISRGHPFLRMLRLLVACAVWVFCHGQATLPHAVDPVALVVTVAAAAHASAERPAEVAPEVAADQRASRAEQRCPGRSGAEPVPPAAGVEPAPAPRDTAPPAPLYLQNCALLC